MDDTKKMLQAIIHGQNAIKQEMVGEIKKVDRKVDKLTDRVGGLEVKIDGVEKRLTERLDKIGMQLAYLEDDTPSREEFDHLEKRVVKLEHQPSSTL